VLQAEEEKHSLGKNPLVHPVLYGAKLKRLQRLSDPGSYSIPKFAKAFPSLLRRSALNRFASFRARLRGKANETRQRAASEDSTGGRIRNTE
jgi:hypothetical protein